MSSPTLSLLLAVLLSIIASSQGEEGTKDVLVRAGEESGSQLLLRDTREAGNKKHKDGKNRKKKGGAKNRKTTKNKNRRNKSKNKVNKKGKRKFKKGNSKGRNNRGKTIQLNGKRKAVQQRRSKNKSGKISGNNKRKERNGKKTKSKNIKNRKRTSRKHKNKNRKNKNKNRKHKNKNKSISQRKMEKDENENVGNQNTARKKEEKFAHCQYLDLTEIGLRNDSACESGGKFLFKAQKGHRRQFLMTNTSNIAVFLKHRHKISNCTALEDITARVKCKAVAGTKSLNITSPVGGCLKTCAKTAIIPGGPGSTGGPEFINNKPGVSPGNAVTLGSSTTVYCPCPEQRTFICSTKVESRANMHKITCNNMAEVTIMCGSDLYGRKTVLGVGLDWYKHPLCTTKEYKSLLIDYVWRCADKNKPVPESPLCPGEAAPPTTVSTTTVTGAPGRRRGRGALSSGRLV